jgi:RNA polymerase sigma-70 factor, ECF subfamily
MSASNDSLLQSRNEAAWDAFYQEHADDVYGFVHRLVGANRHAAEEVFQDLWMEAIRGIAQFDPRQGDARSWLIGIARRQVALFWRKKAIHKRVFPSTDTENTSDVPADAILPLQAIQQLERAAVVRAALLALPPERRQVLVEKYVDGLTVEQMASGNGKSFKTVESLLARARDQLRSLLGTQFQCGMKRERL